MKVFHIAKIILCFFLISSFLTSGVVAVESNYKCTFIGSLVQKNTSVLGQGNEKAFDPGSMNLSVRPGDDFYEYVEGNWIKSHPVPADKSRYGEFEIVRDRTLTVSKE